jgi:transposase InsO family protein
MKSGRSAQFFGQLTFGEGFQVPTGLVEATLSIWSAQKPFRCEFVPSLQLRHGLFLRGVGRRCRLVSAPLCQQLGAARADVFDYIERFYNTIRGHSTIGYLSPAEFEMKVGLA